MLARLAGGGFAAALASLGIGGFGAEAKNAKSCAKRCNKKAKKHVWSSKKKKACKNKCAKESGGGGSGGAGGGGSSAGFRIVSLSDVGEGCTSSATCDTGFCRIIAGIGSCQPCDVLLTCGGPRNEQCCLVGASCINGVCIL